MRPKYLKPTTIVCAGTVVAVLLAAALVTLRGVTAGARQETANLTGTVQIGRDGDSCQRFLIDNKTGFIRHDRHVACREPPKDVKRATAKGTNHAPEHHGSRYSSGARVDAVRDSFKNR